MPRHTTGPAEAERRGSGQRMLVVWTYGPMHYVMTDAAYPGNKHQVTASMVKAGSADRALSTTR
jgi:hypothetical protein